jgi:preflagellin peptidase FlaK
MDWTPALMVAISFIVLALASLSDWRTREASDLYWIIIGGAGLAFLAMDMFLHAPDALYFLFLVPIAIFFFDIFWDRKGIFEDGIYLLPLGLYVLGFVTLGFLTLEFNAQAYFWQLMVIPIMFLLFILLYQFDVIKGGADAKALIALSIMFPLYPLMDNLPLLQPPFFNAQFILPFPLLILFNAALMTIAVPLALFFYNLYKKDIRFPAMLFGYKLSITEAKTKFVWPMERMVDGQAKLSIFPKGSDSQTEQFDQLASAGLEKVWVTPKIPFLVPITAGLVFSAVVGNLFFLFIH